MSEEDTIVAPATAAGESAVALIRLSGPQAFTCLSALGLDSPTPARRASLRRYHALDGQLIDVLLLTCFEAGASYTGEDMLELSTHGSPYIVRRMLEDLCARGARLAEAGEFTRRAFLNGRMDLTQAESVMDLIRARSDQALQAAHRHLAGALGARITADSQAVLGLQARLEAYIDFPEDDLPAEDLAALRTRFSELGAGLQRLAQTASEREKLQEGLKTVLLGAPNAGKSSLMNALLGEERALVDAQAGTTRDFISEKWLLGGWCLALHDTAGLRQSEDRLEQAGVTRSLELLEQADLCLLVLDASEPPPDWPCALEEKLSPERCLLILNKSDLEEHAALPDYLPDFPRVRISAREGSGFEALRARLSELLAAGHPLPAADQLLVSARHAQAIERAAAFLLQAAEALSGDFAIELVAADLREALEALGSVIGRFDTEDMLDLLFSGFCIGK